MRSTTIIAGAGIAGLACAQRLESLCPGERILVFEAADRPGGWIHSERTGEHVIELGPETILDDGSGLSGLIGELGLDGATLPPSAAASKRFIVHGGKLVPLPAGPGSFLRSPLLPLRSKLGIFCEPWRRRGTDAEESFASFIERRFSKPVLEYLAEPFVSGIYAGVPEQMELAACFPKLHRAEQEFGSVLRGMRKLKSGGKSRLLGLAEGNEQVVRVLADSLGDRLRCGTAVESVRPHDGCWRVTLADGSLELAERVILALPARRATHLVQDELPELAAELAGIRFVSLASVHCVFDNAAVPEDVQGFGFLIPRLEARSRVLGVLYSSNLFERKPARSKLFRAMLGGARHPDALELDDAALLAATTATLSDLCGISAQPSHWRVTRHPNALPVFGIGHCARLARIDKILAANPGLHVAGLSYRESGVSGCIRDARRLADDISASARSGSPEASPA